MNGSYIIGIDVGGTKIRAVLLSVFAGKNKWKIIASLEVKTPKTLADFNKSLINLTSTWRFHRQVRKIGIAVPGAVRGNIFVSAANISYIKNFDFEALFSTSNKFFSTKNVKIKTDHDARCFARAEYENITSQDSILFLTLGTGIGRAFGKGGEILKIKKFESAEKWEKEYQKIRDLKDDWNLADFLADRLNGLLKKYKPKILLVGGGVVERNGFLRLLGKAIRSRGFDVSIKKPRFGKNGVAVGASLNIV